jgi:feruloyl esterase
MHHARSIKPLCIAAACAALLAGCGDDDDGGLPQLAAATGASLRSCADLATRFTHPNTTIASAETVAAGTATWGTAAIAEHCLVKGEMYRRTSPQDGQSYAIGFEMRLPKAWNGRFFYQANGGSDGVIFPALGSQPGPQPSVAL